MKNKLFFLQVLPVVWFVVAVVTDQTSADKAYLLSVAPSVWLLLFKDPLSLTSVQLQMAGLPIVFCIGTILLFLKTKPKLAVIYSLALTFILWIALLIFARNGTLIHNPYAVFTWILCCFNLSLCLLPIPIVFTKIFHRLIPLKRKKEIAMSL